ncbi:MAG TPA: M56 family metallopeptidase [Phnomibacter sp.]|nr:M56 family metallopeptidase [Phnomibacter sp.]
MIDIAQSPFLQALGLAIANSLWQAALLWLICFLATTLLKPKANQKYLLVSAAAIVSLVWFVCNTIYYYALLSSTYNGEDAPSLGAGFSQASLFAATVVYQYVHAIMPYLSCAYMLVTALLAVRLLNGFRTVKTLSTTHISKAPVAWRMYVKKYAGILQIEKPVEIWMSSLVQSPLTIGFWKPIILLPIAGINHLSTQQVEAILLHELSHIRRYDYLMNIVLQVAEILLFFNPFVRLLLKQAYQERENSCDDWVLQFDYNGAEYARALLSLEQSSHAHILALGATHHRQFFLLNRIKRIIHPGKSKSDYRAQLSTLSMVMLTMLLMNGFVPALKAKQQAAKHADLNSASFFAPLANMKSPGMNEIDAAVHAFSIARNAAMHQMHAKEDNKKANQEIWQDDGAVMNMVTEEEAVALSEGVLPPAAPQNFEVVGVPAIIEAKQQEAALNGQYEVEGKKLLVQADQQALLQAKQDLRNAELELVAMRSQLGAQQSSKYTDDKIRSTMAQQEKKIAEAAKSLSKELASIGELSYSYTYTDINAEENVYATAPRAKTPSKASANSRYYTIVRGNVIQSKDKKKVTVQLSGNEKEISICMPADSGVVTGEIMKQLEAAGIISIEHKNVNGLTPVQLKKPRVVVSL